MDKRVNLVQRDQNRESVFGKVKLIPLRNIAMSECSNNIGVCFGRDLFYWRSLLFFIFACSGGVSCACLRCN